MEFAEQQALLVNSRVDVHNGTDSPFLPVHNENRQAPEQLAYNLLLTAPVISRRASMSNLAQNELQPDLRGECCHVNGDAGNDGSYEWRYHGRRLTLRRGRSDDNLFEYAGPGRRKATLVRDWKAPVCSRLGSHPFFPCPKHGASPVL